MENDQELKDRFEEDPENYFCFPCGECKHRHGKDGDFPCSKCTHNIHSTDGD